jgi:hypothetical protein
MEARDENGADWGSWEEGTGRDDPARAVGASETTIKMTNEAYRLSK